MTILERIKFEEDWLSEVNLTKENIKIALAGIRATVLEQEQEDCISRQAALAKIDEERKHLLELKMDGAEHIVVHHARRIIEDMPSATPRQKVGEWLEREVIDNSCKVIDEWQSARCSVCERYHTTPYMYYFSHYKFCPNCGAQMEKEAET